MKLSLSLNKEHTYILAVSGGIDSMSLLHFLTKKAYKVIVVHFNHQKRKQSFLDEILVSGFCKNHAIPYHYFILNVPKGNFEGNARILRYQHLKAVAKNYNTPYIMTAHHANDLLETLAMRIYKKHHLLNLVGMQPYFPVDDFIYLKPLLHISKQDIESYAKMHDVAYLEDHTNHENIYLRNKLRNQILPKLFTDTLLDTVIRLSAQLVQTNQSIRQQSLAFINKKSSFLLSDFLHLNILVQDDVILYFLELSNTRISNAFINEIKKQITSSKNSITFKLNDYTLIKSYGQISFALNKGDETLKKPAIFSHKACSDENPCVELCYNELDLPLRVRRKQAGDILDFPYGHKKLSRFLIDRKIPVSKRDTLWCVVDAKNRILWIPDLYLNKTLGTLKKIYLSLKENEHASGY